MPTYDYECPNGHRFEALASHTEADALACKCGATARRLVAAGRYKIGPCMQTEADFRQSQTQMHDPRIRRMLDNGSARIVSGGDLTEMDDRIAQAVKDEAE